MKNPEEFDTSLLFPDLKFKDYDKRVKRLSGKDKIRLEERAVQICKECDIDFKSIKITEKGLEHLSFGSGDPGLSFEDREFKTHNLGGPYLNAAAEILNIYYRILTRS